MQNRQTSGTDAMRGAGAWCCVVVFAVFFACFPVAYADDGPFQIESGQWKSFDHYDDADKRGHLPPPPVVSDEVAPVPPAAIAPPGLAQPAVAPQDPAAPVMAAPKRAVDLPVLPGMNKGFDVKINSTDDDVPPPAAASKDAPGSPDIHLSDKNWADPKATPKSKINDDGEEEIPPLNVRQSFLPSPALTPVPSTDHASALDLGRAQMLKKSVKKDTKQQAKTPEDAAACAAIDAYKQQQLNAIQSDRQTLQALQDAIKSLGLQKQLGFMAGSDSTLNGSTAQSSPSLDIPMSTSTK